MAKQLRAALVFDQRILSEKYIGTSSIILGEAGDFPVASLEGQLTVYAHGRIRIPAGMVASYSASGQKAFAQKMARETALDFDEDAWLILNLGYKLDFVLCHDLPAGGALTKPMAELATLLSSPLSGMLVVSFLLHSLLIFAAFWFAKEEERVVGLAQLQPRWVEMLTQVSQHEEKEEKEEPVPVAEDEDVILAEPSLLDVHKPKADDSPVIANIDKLEKPVGLQAALAGSGLGGMEGLFGSSAGLGDGWDDLPESADGTAMGMGTGFGYGLSGVGFGGGGGGGGFGGGIGGLGGGGGGGGGGKGGKVGGPKKSTVKTKPKIELQEAKEGTFCREGNIRDVVKKRAAALTNCYEQQLLADPSLSGKIIVFWKIGLDGQVTEASIKSSTMKNEHVESCLTKTVRRLRFDKPDGGICVVEFPFVFTSKG